MRGGVLQFGGGGGCRLSGEVSGYGDAGLMGWRVEVYVARLMMVWTWRGDMEMTTENLGQGLLQGPQGRPCLAVAGGGVVDGYLVARNLAVLYQTIGDHTRAEPLLREP